MHFTHTAHASHLENDMTTVTTTYNHTTAHESHVIAYVTHELEALTSTGDVIEESTVSVGGNIYSARSPERRRCIRTTA